MAYNVTVYTLAGCFPCKSLRDWFKQNNIPFEEKVVRLGSPYIQEMESYGGGKKFPFIVVQHNNQTHTFTGLHQKTKQFLLELKES
ncbi:glutaredoxin family protein [Evansella clarkii]|uniref:glutaredoxin family protein n=1 Tax=Evansella clarkii TaxID=79879 RepID=UPI000996B7E2|nr:glutaredoxin family protein [Evansella clarkii]